MLTLAAALTSPAGRRTPGEARDDKRHHRDRAGPGQGPITVGNFLEYVKSDFYDGTVFHRVIPAS